MGALRRAGDNVATQLKAFVGRSAFAATSHKYQAEDVPVPDRLAVPDGKEQSTQSAFGRILMDLAKAGDPLGDLIVTTAPNVYPSGGDRGVAAMVGGGLQAA